MNRKPFSEAIVVTGFTKSSLSWRFRWQAWNYRYEFPKEHLEVPLLSSLCINETRCVGYICFFSAKDFFFFVLHYLYTPEIFSLKINNNFYLPLRAPLEDAFLRLLLWWICSRSGLKYLLKKCRATWSTATSWVSFFWGHFWQFQNNALSFCHPQTFSLLVISTDWGQQNDWCENFVALCLKKTHTASSLMVLSAVIEVSEELFNFVVTTSHRDECFVGLQIPPLIHKSYQLLACLFSC